MTPAGPRPWGPEDSSLSSGEELFLPGRYQPLSWYAEQGGWYANIAATVLTLCGVDPEAWIEGASPLTAVL